MQGLKLGLEVLLLFSPDMWPPHRFRPGCPPLEIHRRHWPCPWLFGCPCRVYPRPPPFLRRVLATSLPVPGYPADGCQAVASFEEHCRLFDRQS